MNDVFPLRHSCLNSCKGSEKLFQIASCTSQPLLFYGSLRIPYMAKQDNEITFSIGKQPYFKK